MQMAKGEDPEGRINATGITVPTNGKRNPAPTLARTSRIGKMKPE